MRMTWSELLFAHWSVDPKHLAGFIPKGLHLDTFNGQAWVGVVPFLMSDVAQGVVLPSPSSVDFLELNVRTYVIHDGKPGVWFFSLDAENPVAVRVARTTFHLPYMDAAMSLSGNESTSISYCSERTHRGEPPANFEANYAPVGDSFYAQPGTLEHWLTARYCLYSADRRGRLYRGEIDHPPWTLAAARCEIIKIRWGKRTNSILSSRRNLLYSFHHPSQSLDGDTMR